MMMMIVWDHHRHECLSYIRDVRVIDFLLTFIHYGTRTTTIWYKTFTEVPIYQCVWEILGGRMRTVSVFYPTIH